MNNPGEMSHLKSDPYSEGTITSIKTFIKEWIAVIEFGSLSSWGTETFCTEPTPQTFTIIRENSFDSTYLPDFKHIVEIDGLL